MGTSIKIVGGKRGWHLKVNGLFISKDFHRERSILSIVDQGGIPYGATEWVSIQAIRKFWSEYMAITLASTKRPHLSVWGQLKPVTNQ